MAAAAARLSRSLNLIFALYTAAYFASRSGRGGGGRRVEGGGALGY